MATVQNVEALLKDAGLTELASGGACFSGKVRDVHFRPSEAEVDEYIRIKDNVTQEPETAVYYPRHYEHLLDFMATLSPALERRRGKVLTTLGNNDKSLIIEITEPSTPYLLTVLHNTLPRMSLMEG